MLGRLVLCAGLARAMGDATISASIDNRNNLFPISQHYVAVNIDTGSLYNLLDFSDITLRNLMSQLVGFPYSPPAMILRIGGGAADDTLFTGPNGPSGAGQSPWSNTVLVNTTYWDAIIDFANATNAGIVWNLNGVLRDKANAWDPTVNATALFQHVVDAGQQAHILGWQLGNEPTLWKKRGVVVTGTQLGADYIKLRQVLASYPSLSQTIYGPEGCCGDTSFLADFLPVVHAGKALDYLSEHYYPITPNPAACTVPEYLNKSRYEETLHIMAGYQAQVEELAPGTPVVLGETATTNMGGCHTLSASFVSGFYWMYLLGQAAATGIAQVNRQDLVGFSSQTEVSQYMLAGVPGWTSEASSGPLRPHPDWYTTILWKQHVMEAALNVSWNAGAYNSSIALHAYCGVPQDSSQKGAVVLSFVNTGGDNAQLNLAGMIGQMQRMEYILTSTATPAPGAPPASLTDDSIYLNGQLLSVDASGRLPQGPLPGVQKGPSQPITLPPYSYGMLFFGDAGLCGPCSC